MIQVVINWNYPLIFTMIGQMLCSQSSVLYSMWRQRSHHKEETEGHTSPQGSGVERSHTSCSPHHGTPADCLTGSLIVQIYHPLPLMWPLTEAIKDQRASPRTRCFTQQSRQCGLSLKHTKCMKD